MLPGRQRFQDWNGILVTHRLVDLRKWNWHGSVMGTTDMLQPDLTADLSAARQEAWATSGTSCTMTTSAIDASR